MKKSLGFTLIELMITVAILAILVGIGVPSYQNTVQQSRMDDATKLIKQALSYSKNTAIAHNRTLYMTPSNNTLTLATGIAGVIDVINKTTIATDSNSSLSFTGAGIAAITFRANGTIAAGNTIRYCTGDTGDTGIEIAVGLNGEAVVTSVTC